MKFSEWIKLAEELADDVPLGAAIIKDYFYGRKDGYFEEEFCMGFDVALSMIARHGVPEDLEEQFKEV